MRRRLSGRFIALVTAYALAVNALMPVLVLGTMLAASGEAAVVCFGKQGDAGGAPASHGPDCPFGMPCASHGCAGASIAGGHSQGAIGYPLHSLAVDFTAPGAIDPRSLHVIGSHAARAPPEASPDLR
jgi:hypothetical protein